MICWNADGIEIPFYVGQTNRPRERMQDYAARGFKACTDFRVGSAVEYMTDYLHVSVTVRYKRSDTPRADERAWIRDLILSGYRLLNCLPAYDYRTANQEEERQIVQKFCDMLSKQSTAARASVGSS